MGCAAVVQPKVNKPALYYVIGAILARGTGILSAADWSACIRGMLPAEPLLRSLLPLIERFVLILSCIRPAVKEACWYLIRSPHLAHRIKHWTSPHKICRASLNLFLTLLTE